MAKRYGIQLKGLGKALKPKGPGVLRPKPQDRYGQPFKPKPIKPGKKDGGSLNTALEKLRDASLKTPSKKMKPLAKPEGQRRRLKPVKPSQRGLQSLPKDVRNKMGYMKDGGKAKKFPDLTGDGKVTRADVLKGRGVFRKGGAARPTGKVLEAIKQDYKKNKPPKGSKKLGRK